MFFAFCWRAKYTNNIFFWQCQSFQITCTRLITLTWLRRTESFQEKQQTRRRALQSRLPATLGTPQSQTAPEETLSWTTLTLNLDCCWPPSPPCSSLLTPSLDGWLTGRWLGCVRGKMFLCIETKLHLFINNAFHRVGYHWPMCAGFCIMIISTTCRYTAISWHTFVNISATQGWHLHQFLNWVYLQNYSTFFKI